MWLKFLRNQENQLIDLKLFLKRYVNTIPEFGFISGRYDLKIIKFYLMPYLICDKGTLNNIHLKSHDFKSFRFGDVQFLDKMKFLGGAATLNSILKAYKASETKTIFPYEWFANHARL